MRPRLLTSGERGRLRPSPSAARQVLTHISSKVSVSFGWYDQANGVVSWNFANADAVQHSVILLRNGYYFGGAYDQR